jgi:rfaE bifunctional protein nucleotidyltransferase chain/domain
VSRDCGEKLRSAADAAREIAELRKAGRTVVLANGVFDLFHVGHVRYLRGARAEGDFLVVAVNGDASTRRLKGSGRPFQPVEDRAAVVGALECVDRVVVFEEPTVEGVLRALRPDVHAKGTDYTEDTVPERAVTAGIGGRTAIVGDPKDHSSTDLIRRILASARDTP